MSRKNELTYALNAGAVDIDSLSRIDLEKMRLAGQHPVNNFFPRALGPMSLRPGLEHLSALSASYRMVEFIRDSDTTALLLFGNETILVYDSDGQPVTVANASTTITNPDFVSGSGGWTDVSDTGDGTDATATMTASAGVNLVATKYRTAAIQQSVSVILADQAVAHTIRIVVTRGPIFFRVGTTAGDEDVLTEQRLMTGTHKLTFTPNAATIYLRFRSEEAVTRIVDECRFEHTALGGAGNLSLPAPWTSSELEFLAWDQSADVLFVGDGTYQPRRIERRGATSWSIVLYQTRNGPLKTPSTNKVTLTPSAQTGNGTLTSNVAYFKPSHVGALFEISHEQQNISEEVNGLNQSTDFLKFNGIFISGSGETGRNLTYSITATGWTGDIALERSLDGELWDVIITKTGTTVATSYNDTQSNLLVYYRFRVTSYTAGSAIVTLSYAGGLKIGQVRCTGYTSATSVSYEVINPLGATVTTPLWRGPAWSDDLGWPRVPRFRDDRLHWFLGGRDYASIVDDYDNYDDSREGDSAPISRSVGAGADEGVRWALDMDKFVAGTSGFVAAIQASDFGEVLTPTSYTVRRGPTLGASFVPPVQVDDVAVMADKTNTRLYDVSVPAGESKLKSTDLSRLNPSAVSVGIVDMAVQRQPETRVYVVLSDGTCAVLTFDRADNVIAYTTLDTDGTIEDVAVLPGATQDDVYFIVLKNSTRRLVRLAGEAVQRAVGTCTLLDHYKVLTGSISSITGATHLASQTVSVWADGQRRSDVALNGSGVGSLGATYSRVVYGVSYDAEYLSVKLAYAAQLGTAIGQTKIIKTATPILSNSCLDGIRIGSDSTNCYQLPPYVNGALRTTNQFFTHYDEEPFPIPSDWDTDSRIYIKAISAEGPATIQAIVFDLETRDGVRAQNG